MIKEWIRGSSRPSVVALRNSLKELEIEERLDLVFHRPLGLLVSRAAIRWGVSATRVSLLSLLSGLLGGAALSFRGNPVAVIAAAILLTLSAVFDSADGQVARATGTSSRAGHILDGIIDTVVYVAVFVFATLALLPTSGPAVWFLAALGGFSFSFRAMMFEWYKNEFLYYYTGHDASRNMTVAEARAALDSATGAWPRLSRRLYHDYVIRQHWFASRREEVRQGFDTLRADAGRRDRFRRRYRETLAPLMTAWALLGGTNITRILIIAFCLFGRFDLYLWLSGVPLSVAFALMVAWQGIADRRLLAEFGLTTASARLTKTSTPRSPRAGESVHP
jgi:phosphatidylglycerophosphate synthase